MGKNQENGSYRMLDGLKENLHLLKTAKPGERFEAYFEQSHDPNGSHFLRVFTLVSAALIVLIGIILMPAPGPGMVVVAAGLALMAGESRWLAKRLDRLEVKVRGWFKK